jgi:Zn-dependent protease with chaperone function
MQYQPSLPEHNDNVSHIHPGREFLLILLGMAALAAIAFVLLGLLVDFTVNRLSDETEAKINAAVSFKLTQEKPYLPERQAMLQQMTDELRECAGLRQPVAIHFIQNKQPNAAILPGGQIFVFSGLLDKVKSQNGLAFVLAHELGHMKNRDHLRAMGRSLVFVVAASLLTGSHSDLTQVLVPINQVGSARYSQTRESEADRAALKAVNCRFGHVGGATEFFEAMKSEDGMRSAWLHSFSSHPELQMRIDALNQAARTLNFRVGATTSY